MADTPDTTPVIEAADTIQARLSTATVAELMQMARGGIGEPESSED